MVNELAISDGMKSLKISTRPATLYDSAEPAGVDIDSEHEDTFEAVSEAELEQEEDADECEQEADAAESEQEEDEAESEKEEDDAHNESEEDDNLNTESKPEETETGEDPVSANQETEGLRRSSRIPRMKKLEY